MKLLRYGPKGQEKPGMLDAEGRIRDLSAHAPDFAGAGVSNAALAALRGVDPASLPLVDGSPRIGACLASIPNFFCIGLNYAEHAKESGAAVPAEPILFNKTTSCLSGPYDDVIIPKGSVKADWEVELGVVIGDWCEHVSEADALSKVAGYCVINDVSEREWQIERGGQWTKGKSAPTFGPCGPWLVTADEVPDPQALPLWLELNGERVQNHTTGDMIFGVAHIVSYMSRFMALQPGDVIATGTPQGVGMGMKPQRFLKPGDTMRLSIEGLGEQFQTARAYGA
jgi:2-keto-4-pentenoate hydratase/2-oxohepta-3-ene-1,7-dioic acid hydratase in catechol pathway